MNTLVLTNRDLLELSMLTRSQLEFFVKNKLKTAGFNLDKPIEMQNDPSTGNTIYTQKEDE
jgi:hypothetical protein